jgi:hypothetical protein
MHRRRYIASVPDLELGVGGHVGRLTKPAIYKVGYKSGNPQRNRMSTNQKSPCICPAIHHRVGSVISITSDVEESLMEPDTDPEHYSPENQLGLLENRAWFDHSDVSNVSEASGKHWFVCRQMEAEDST